MKRLMFMLIIIWLPICCFGFGNINKGAVSKEAVKVESEIKGESGMVQATIEKGAVKTDAKIESGAVDVDMENKGADFSKKNEQNQKIDTVSGNNIQGVTGDSLVSIIGKIFAGLTSLVVAIFGLLKFGQHKMKSKNENALEMAIEIINSMDDGGQLVTRTRVVNEIRAYRLIQLKGAKMK